MAKQLILVELNEVNFNLVNYYIEAGVVLPGFSELLSKGLKETESEIAYENLEPWIQWPSVHTGKTFDEHKIFRLGDFTESTHIQFFERVEREGYSVGAVSPMNATNKLEKPAYFIPDPWTQTPSDNSYFSKSITSALRQAVNDNSQAKLTLKTVFNLGLAFVALVSPARYRPLFFYALRARSKPWRKALFLDMLLYEIHKTLWIKKAPNFSTLFLNAGAHIQHHYFFNSPYVKSKELKNPIWFVPGTVDPVLEMLKVYDAILTDLLKLTNTEFIVATGLSQKPYEHLRYYYRLKDHAAFLRLVGIEFATVAPRMTRDFLVTFETADQALIAEQRLSQIIVNGEVKLFEEIDNRGKDLFVVLTYPSEVTDRTVISYVGGEARLRDLVIFVAVKNGEHQSTGFAVFSEGVLAFAPRSGSHVSEIHRAVLQFFGVSDRH